MPISTTSKVFGGEVLHSDYAYPNQPVENKGKHLVVIPETRDDVAVALQAAVRANPNIKRVIRSGQYSTTGEYKDASAGVVVHLGQLNGLELNGLELQEPASSSTAPRWELTAEAGVTNQDVISKLAEQSLALPIDTSLFRTISSNLVNEQVPMLVRSLGTLADTLTAFTAVTLEGNPISWSDESPTSWQDALESSAALTSVSLRTMPADDLWMRRVLIAYPGIDNAKQLAGALFSESFLRDRVDVSLRIHEGPFDTHWITVLLVGVGDVPDDLESLLAAALKLVGIHEHEFERKLYRFIGNDVLNELTTFGSAVSADTAILSKRLPEETEVGFSPSGGASVGQRKRFIKRLLDQAHRHVPNREDGGGLLEGDARLDIRIQFDQGGGLRSSGFRYEPRVFDEQSKGFHEYPDLEREGLSISSPLGPIPSFRGELFFDGGTPRQKRLYDQFCKLPYSSGSVSDSRHRPYMFCRPTSTNHDGTQSVEDLVNIIRYAKQTRLPNGERLAVVARSGGHQFSGLSGGRPDTIVILMDHFDRIAFDAVDKTLVHVGAAVTVSRLTKRLKPEGLAVPHGECVGVAVGGHGQTGGYGHLSRGLGFFQDYIESVRIVLASGEAQEVHRPDSVSAQKNGQGAFGDNLFWAVLGGNAGSFGVIWEYTLRCAEDSKYMGSNTYTAIRFYTRPLFADIANKFRAWSHQAAAGTLPEGMDYFLTLQSGSWAARYNIMSFDNSRCSPAAQTLASPLERDELDQMYDRRGFLTDTEETWWARLRLTKGLKPNLTTVSALSDHFTRKANVMPGGREFSRDYRYIKRAHCTQKPLTPKFVEELVKLVDEVMTFDDGIDAVGNPKKKRITLSCELFIGGAKYQDPLRRVTPASHAQSQSNQPVKASTALPHRDMVFGITFDTFYLPDPDGANQRQAEQFQQRASIIFREHLFPSPTQEGRMFWGTFGDDEDLNMSSERVRNMYYDSKEDYDKLLKIKQDVDPSNLFRNLLTVQPITH